MKLVLSNQLLSENTGAVMGKSALKICENKSTGQFSRSWSAPLYLLRRTDKVHNCWYLMIIKRWFCWFPHKNLCCGCSLESPGRGDYNEHPQDRFLWRTDKIFQFSSNIIKHAPYLFFCLLNRWCNPFNPNSNFQASSHFLWLNSRVCIRPGLKPGR